MKVSVFSPAKINLYLAVTGRRTDGFHDLVSVAAPLDFGDELEADGEREERRKGERKEEEGGTGQFSLACDDSSIPADESNLVLMAAAAFAAATEWNGVVHFRLKKRIPAGAGLGGGSSNAVAALRALNRLAGGPLSEEGLGGIAATLGSDCALFLHGAPVVMRGRGERIEVLDRPAADRLRGRRVLLFKPGFAVGTPWAYRRMAQRGTDYEPAEAAEARLADWRRGGAPAEDLLSNNMEPAVFEKFIALPVFAEKLRRDHGVRVQMSGSGSACFALLRDDHVTSPLTALIRECWGPRAFVQEARLA